MDLSLRWLRAHDAGLNASRRALRTAIIMPSLFAIGVEAIGNSQLATFAAFGSFAVLMFVDYTGTRAERVQSQLALGVAGATFICIGTLASRATWLAVVAMIVVGFAVLFAGVVSSVLAGSSTSLLLTFILPVTLPGSASSIPDRLAGWGLAVAASLLAITLLWPAPARDPLRRPVLNACRLLAARIRADVTFVSGPPDASPRERDDATEAARAAVTTMRAAFYGAPFRPTGLTTAARTVVRLVDLVGWLGSVLDASPPSGQPGHPNKPVCAVKLATATALERGADVLAAHGLDPAELRAAEADLRQALLGMEAALTTMLPVGRHEIELNGDHRVAELVSSLEPSFRAQEMSFAVSLIASNIDLTAAAERRTWWQRLLGRQPAGVPGTLVAAEERAAAHLDPKSVWLHNSVRGGLGLGIAVLVAELVGVQHSFWVVLGTLSVLRSNALNTGQNALRGLAGTVVGFAVGGVVVSLVGSDTTVLWILLPLAVLFAGLAPAAFSFAAGQAGFTIAIVILFNIIAPAGWKVGLVRVEDVAIGCAVSLAVGAVFWPRGAGSALGAAIADAYSVSAAYLRSAVEFGTVRCDGSPADVEPPRAESLRAAAAARRLDDAFREYLAERGTKRVPLVDVTALMTGVAGLRLAADAVLDLWDREDGVTPGDRGAARRELDAAGERVAGWYDELASALSGGGEVPEPLARDLDGDSRLIEAARSDLNGADGQGSATAVRMIWSGDHLDAARRLQATVVEPARLTRIAQHAFPF